MFGSQPVCQMQSPLAMALLRDTSGFLLFAASLLPPAHAVKEYMVPAVFIVNSFGISLLRATIVSKPEQCAGTT